MKGLAENEALWKEEKGKSTGTGNSFGSKPSGFVKRPGSFGGSQSGAPRPRI